MKEAIQRIVQQFAQVQTQCSDIVHPCNGSKLLTFAQVEKMVDTTQELLFPGYYANNLKKGCNLDKYTEKKLLHLQRLVEPLVKAAFCFICDKHTKSCPNKEAVRQITLEFLESLPSINKMLITDVEATMKNDPAAGSLSEIIFAYPGFKAITHHRIAHQLFKLGVPILPRIISEIAHSNTGIDIHPEAQVGEYFAIDHGTGTVIGGTCIIGRHVTVYQGVTLGAKNFQVDSDGSIVKGQPRHPIVEDSVTIYAGAKVLGRITIGANSVVGANVWITDNVAPNSRMLNRN
ncbi:MAG: serine acetyltransferase [Prevotellaceae bacterium]|jgi:serine O-acetyltransferase|nr:serine acetyltransferase [Prevotellaceae bacterium]